MSAAKEQLRRSYALPTKKRRALLREMQLKWHPDKASEYESEASRALADEVVRMVNKAANVARDQAAEASKLAKKEQAYDALTALLNGKAGSGSGKALEEELRRAVQEARDAGVSDTEVVKGEARLRQVSQQTTR